MSEGGGGGDGGGGYPGGPTPSSTVPDQQDSKSGLPPFSSFGEMDPVTGRINTDGEALQTSRLLDISSWDYYGEGLTGRLLDRGDGFPMLIPQPQYRPWESKDGHHEFPGSPLNKLPSFQSQFTAFPQDQNGETVLTTLTPAPASPNSSSSGLPSFHTLSTVPPRGYPLVPAPVQAREIPSIQQQILDERHIHLFQGAPHQQYHQLGAYQPQQQATLLTVVKTEPLIVTQLQSGYEHHQDLGVKMEDANSPRGYLDSRKKERRKIRASSMESSNESDGVGSSSVESSGQVAAISSTAGFKSPLACHQPNMHSEDDMHDMSDKPVKKKRKRCGECIGCQRKDNCGDCAPCRNDKSHQICKMRRCEKLTEKKHLLYLNHDYPRGERGRGRGKGRGGARGKRSGFGTTSVAPSDSYRKLHQTPRSPLASPNLQLNGGVDSNNMMSAIPDHAVVRGETKIEPQVTQTNLPPITGATMPLYSSNVQPGMETGGFTTPLRDHRFGNSVWQAAAATPDPNGSWTPQGQFIQQIPPQIEEIRYPQYAVSGYPQATPVVGYQQNSFMQANGNLYNGTPQPQPSPHSMHNGNSRSTPTLNGNLEYVEQSPRPSEYMNGTYPHSNQPDVMVPPTPSTPTSRCGSAHLENGEGKYTNPPTPTTPSNQGNAMPGYPLQIPPQSVQSSRNSSGYPGHVNESTERGNNGEDNNPKSSDNNELWSSSPRPSESSKEEIQQLDNHQMHKSSDSWGEGRNGSSQGSAQSVWSTPGSDISTSQHQQQDAWPSSPQQVNQSMQQQQKQQQQQQQHQQQQQQQQMQEAQHQRYQQHHQQQMNQAQMQHPQKSPQMSKEDQQQMRRQQPSPQMHQPPTSTQSQHVRMQQHSPMMSQHQMQQQVQMHQQQAQSQQQAQMHQQQAQSQQQEQMHQQQLAQLRQQNQMHHQQSQNPRQPLQIQSQQSRGALHHQLPSPVHQQHTHIQQNQMTHHNMQGHHGSQSLHMMQHQSNVHHHHQQMMGGQGSSPQHQEMWSSQPNSRPPSQNPPEPWPNESANQQQMWTNDKKSDQFNERAELNNRLKTMILNKQQQEMKKIQDGGHLGYQDQKNLPPVSSGNFLALGHHPRKLLSEGGGFRSGGSYRNDGLHAIETIVNSVKCPENFVYSDTPVSQPENFMQRMASAKYYQVSSQTQTSSQTISNVSSPIPPSRRRSPPPVSVQKIKQEPLWDEKSWSSPMDPERSHQPIKDQAVEIETDASCENPGSPFGDDRLKAIKEESFDSDPSKEYSFDEGDIKTEEDIKLSPEHIERLKVNARGDVPSCECFPPDHIPAEPGPYYTHLGYAKSLEELRENIEKRSGLVGKAIRIEKVIFTGKEGKTTSGCPLGKWIIRRSGPEEKVLMVVKNRKGHVCATSWIVIISVAWEGVPASMADDLYATVTDKLKNYGVVTSRRCGVNEPRTCACQGLDNTTCGASFSFGCSWSMYYNGCKFARSKTARKFKLSVKTEEQCMEDKLQNLATYLSPLYKTIAPESYANMTMYEEEAVDCRLGLQSGRPWSGVTACFDFCAHAHRDIHNMNNGCTTVVTLTKHRGFERPDDEQLHVLPLYVIDESDEFGSKEGYHEKVKSGAIEVLTKYPCEIRTRQTPLQSCRKLAKKRKDEREHAKRALAYKMSTSSEYSSDSHQTTSCNDHPVHNGLNSNVQQNYFNYPSTPERGFNYHSTPEKGPKPRGISHYQQPSEMSRSEMESMSQMMQSPHRSVYPPSPFRSPLRVVTQSPGSVCLYSAPTTPEMGKPDRDVYFSPAASPRSVFRRPVGRPPSRSSNPATPQPHIDSTYLKPQDKMDSPYSQGMESDRSFYNPLPPHYPSQHPYSPVYPREHTSPLPGMHSFMSPLRDGFGSRNTAFNTYCSRSYESQSAPASPVCSTANPLRPRSTYPTGIPGITAISSPGSKCSSVSTQCSPSRSPYHTMLQTPSPSPSQSSGYWSGSQSDVRETFFPGDHPMVGYSPPKWSPLSRHSGFTSSPSQATFSTPSTPTCVSSQQSLPSFQNLTRRKTIDQTDFSWSPYSPVPAMSQDQSWRPVEPNIQKNYLSSQHYSGLPSFKIEHCLQERSTAHAEHAYHIPEPSPSPSKEWARESQTPPWNGPNQVSPRTPDVEPQNLLGSVTDFTNNEDCFSDPSVGGVAVALCHGSVLFEVAKHELHATTALKTPNRFHPTRISLVFYQHRNMNKSDHGRGEWREKQRCKKELADKHAEMAERAAEMAERATEMAEKATTTASIATQSLDVQTEPHSVGTAMEHMSYNYFPMQHQPPSPMHRYSPMAHTSLNQPPAPQMQTVSTPSAWGNLFPLHPSVVQGPYPESETLG